MMNPEESWSSIVIHSLRLIPPSYGTFCLHSIVPILPLSSFPAQPLSMPLCRVLQVRSSGLQSSPHSAYVHERVSAGMYAVF